MIRIIGTVLLILFAAAVIFGVYAYMTREPVAYNGTFVNRGVEDGYLY